jgi:hypothetical protein
MIQSTVMYGNETLADIYFACTKGVVNGEVNRFLEELAKYATTNLSKDSKSDIKITKQKLLDILDINNIYGNNLTSEKKTHLMMLC